MGIVNQIKMGCLIRQQTDAQKGVIVGHHHLLDSVIQ
jgi:hypothetical protein